MIRSIVWVLSLFSIAAMIAPRDAVGASYYRVIPLASDSTPGSLTYNADVSGTIHAIVDSDGRQYAFDKSPVTYNQGFDQEIESQSPEQLADRSFDRVVASNKFGTIGYSVSFGHGGLDSYVNGWTELANGTYSSELSYLGAFRHEFSPLFGPFADLNASGQVVGTVVGTSAGFSDTNFRAHRSSPLGNNNLSYDDLNQWIPQSLGIHLTSAMRIDDLGRIVAFGTTNKNGTGGQDYLLEPEGVPVATPEPTAALVLLTGLAGAGWRRRQSGRQRG